MNEFLHKYPDIEDHVEKIAAKAGIEKAFIVLGAICIPCFILLSIGSSNLLM